MDKQNVSYLFKTYYSAIKRNKVVIHATTWMNPENNMLSERSKTQKGTYCMIPLYEISRVSKSIETENR